LIRVQIMISLNRLTLVLTDSVNHQT